MAENNNVSTDFSYLDQYSSEEIADFKSAARLKSIESVHSEKYRLETAAADAPRKIIAEGDSWFDYLPGIDLIDCLINLFDYEIENYAKAGDTLENMIFGTGVTKHFQREVPQIYTILRRIEQTKPKVFLFSGGGNDVAGDEFKSFLNHSLSGLLPFRIEYAEEIINHVFRKYFEGLISAVAQRSPNTHIVTHGYGHTLPTGVGVDLLFSLSQGRGCYQP